ncbi:hypothetical protein FHW88_006104 [Mucilaginibacter sp. SG538B]|uniref:hypothetical protein n=1 Tax=Mucilaginibacter sp. SG538B TaxID=2587021 RepID=UPI00159D327A|nr:hypothetical protein [Mucilaginibacter sp. SG538B]NVM67773.1 hypothetical protein [Mucilaginibacter sp. SG538B]
MRSGIAKVVFRFFIEVKNVVLKPANMITTDCKAGAISSQRNVAHPKITFVYVTNAFEFVAL